MAMDNFSRKVGTRDFVADQSIKEICASGNAATDLQTFKQTVLNLAEETSGQLKKNVYQNYIQFIETAKEISYLESEMYQLSHMLTEQKSLLSAMLETSVIGAKPPSVKPTTNPQLNTNTSNTMENKISNEPKKSLTSLLEKVEGCASVVDVPGRYLVYDGELQEYDPNTLHPIVRIRAFLLNDSLVFTTWMPNRSGPVRYKFQVLYELDSLPVVNVKDIKNDLKNAFKILMFPEARLFVCESLKQKNEWLQLIETTKKAKRNAENSRRESQLEILHTASEESSKRSSTISSATLNPFGDDDDEEEDEEDSLQEQDENHNALDHETEWLQELPEDLDVCIAQRDFEGATALVEKANDFIQNHIRIQHVKEMRPRIDHRVKLLTDELQNELRVSPDRSLHGGPRAARRAVSLLIRLGKSAKACELFLNNRSATIKQSLKQLKLEGDSRMYVKRSCEVFFTHITDACVGLEQLFGRSPGAWAGLVIWTKEELRGLVNSLSRQVFTPQVSLSVVSDCVVMMKLHCNKLADFGLDLTFVLDNLMKPYIERAFIETKEKLLEAIKLRTTEDKWRPINLHTKLGLEKFMEDALAQGITNLQSYVIEECKIALTSSTLQFSKVYLAFAFDTIKLECEDMNAVLDEALFALAKAQLKHVEKYFKETAQKKEKDFIQKNGHFIISTILPMVEQRYKEVLGVPCLSLPTLYRNYAILQLQVTKYSSTDYL
ncbi:exocyst complex component exo84 [Chamberlinius hualienensis]